MPMLDVAHVAQGIAHVPGEETPAEAPEEGQEAVDEDVDAGVEADTTVQEDGEGEGGDGEEGGGCELNTLIRKKMSASMFLFLPCFGFFFGG